MLGYSSVMHMGYIFLGIAALQRRSALSGAALLMFAHGLSIAALFALAGQLRESARARSRSTSSAASPRPPRCSPSPSAFAAFASIGLPGFANFASEMMVFFGAFRPTLGRRRTSTRFQLATIFALWGVVISAVYMLRAYRAIFFGTAASGLYMKDPAFGQRLPLLLLAPCCSSSAAAPACCSISSNQPGRPRRSRVSNGGRHETQSHAICRFSPLKFFWCCSVSRSCSLAAFLPKVTDRTLARTGIAGCVVALLLLAGASRSVDSLPALRRAVLLARLARAVLQRIRARHHRARPRLVAESEKHAQRTFSLDRQTRRMFGLPLIVCAGLMWMASAKDFVIVFVALELVTVSFYVLVAYTRKSALSLEAGVKYLILGAARTGFLVYGITWIFGVTGHSPSTPSPPP